MKNRINIWKATIAVSALLLSGCVDSSSEDIYEKYGYYDSYDDVILTEGQSDMNAACSVKRTAKKESTPAVSVSYVAEPDIVPVKPKCNKKCKVKKTVATKSVAGDTEVQEKPVVTVVENDKKELAITVDGVEVAPVSVVTPVAVKKNAIEITQEEKEWAQREAARMKAEEEESMLRAQREAEQKKAEEEERLRAEREAEELRAQREAAEKQMEDILIVEEEDFIIDEKLPQGSASVKTSQKTVKDGSCEEDVKDWVASEGATLRSLLMEWGDKAGWRIIWNMDRDYTLQASAVFRGRFVDVAAALLRSFARATPAPKGVFYKGNKVLVISTREDENAD